MTSAGWKCNFILATLCHGEIHTDYYLNSWILVGVVILHY